MLRGLAVDRGAVGRGLIPNRGGRGRGVPVGSILDLLPVWAIDARSGAVDLVGAVDPVPMTASLLDPADGAVQAVSMSTNEGGDGVNSTGSYLWTADSVANSITGDIDIRALCRAMDDSTNDGLVPQTVKVAKYLGDVVNSFDYMVSILTNGDAHMSIGLAAAEVAASEDPYGYKAYRMTRVSATGVVNAYVEASDGAVVTADGRKWTLLGTTTGGTGALPNTTNAILTFMIGKGVGGWCQVYSGVDGTLVVDMDIERDATAGLVATETFVAASGETWTLNEGCATFGVDRKAWAVGSPGDSADGPFIVPDDPVVDITTGDFTVACVFEPSTLASGGADFRPLFAKFNPATIGTTGVGWGFVDYSPLGGAGFAINDGSGLKAAFGGTWTAARHLLVATGDRDGNLRFFLDDVTTAAATTDITACSGTLANALTLGPALSSAQPSLLGAAAKWDRVLTAGELARLPALLGAS